MEQQPKKKPKMNALGYISIVVTFALMVFVKYKSIQDATVLERLLEGSLTYIFCLFGGGLLAVALLIGIYLVNLFLNAIYDTNDEAPSWDLVTHIAIVFAIVLYIVEITGVHIEI